MTRLLKLYLAFPRSLGRKYVLAADDDECEALWGMFGVDDLDLEEVDHLKKQPEKTATAATAPSDAVSLGSKAAGKHPRCPFRPSKQASILLLLFLSLVYKCSGNQ